MNTISKTSFISLIVILVSTSTTTNAFTVSSSSSSLASLVTNKANNISNKQSLYQKRHVSSITMLYSTPEEKGNEQDGEIERLRSMAAKLRAEAAALEAEKAQELAIAAEKAFAQFDTDKDGEISVKELKEGLEKVLKTELSEKRVQELMNEFDASGDGALQLEEFVSIDMFRNKLELLAQEEKRLALEAKERAKKEAMQAALEIAKVDILNEKEPTNSDKLLSVLPYLFPLLDGLQWGRFLLSADGAESNPFVIGLALLYALYRSIPFSGFLAFFVLNFLGGVPSINRLIRYNMQQAVFLDIALFFPGLITAAIGLTGLQFPAIMSQFGNDVIFVTLLITVAYCSISSLLGITPDKIPFISGEVDKRMPSIEMFDLDAEGNIVFRPRDEEEDNQNNTDDKDKKQ